MMHETLDELIDLLVTWSFASRKARMVAGMIPLMPPPSMLRTVTNLRLLGSVLSAPSAIVLAISDLIFWWHKASYALMSYEKRQGRKGIS
jgi:hypothetical protein